jgi:putative phosphoribosyl transferase
MSASCGSGQNLPMGADQEVGYTPASAPRVFVDRRDAGRRLADRLKDERIGAGVIVGLARGGVEVAAEVARRLGLPLDALAVRKVGHPFQPEYAIGAVTSNGSVYLRPNVDLPPEQVREAVDAAQATAVLLDRRLHAGRGSLSVRGRICVLVDDGLATGATMTAAIDWARRHQAGRVVVAVPVGAPQTVTRLERDVDRLVCLEAPARLSSVGEWYREFAHVSDEQVIALLDTAARAQGREMVVVEAGALLLPGDLTVPAAPIGAVIFAHGSGSSRHSPRNRYVAERLNAAGLATLLFDLLTEVEARDRSRVFDIPLLGRRLVAATKWFRVQPRVGNLPIGYFGASTGAAAALWAAAESGQASAVVSRGGRPDLAEAKLADIQAPTLLIVGGDDREVLELNRRARQQMRCVTELVVVPDATHLFQEPGALEQVSDAAVDWFQARLGGSVSSAPATCLMSRR